MRALVLAGGGAKGSWQAGAIKALACHPEYHGGFSFVAGTSVGALNAAAVAQHYKADFPEAVKLLDEIWHSKLDIWCKKFPPYVAGLWSPSIGSNKGLRSLLDNFINLQYINESNVRLNATAVSLQSGKVRRFTDQDPDLKQGLLASSSFPIAFPPEEIDGELYTDGGVRDNAPLGQAIKAGATEIVVVLCNDPDALEHDPKAKGDFRSVFSVGMQVIEIMTAEILMNDIRKCHLVNALVDAGESSKRKVKLSIFFPQQPLGGPLDFSPGVMKKQFAMGYADVMSKLP